MNEVERQIDRMINEGLGAGWIFSIHDFKKYELYDQEGSTP
jgi:hypothetical protein